MKKRILGFVLAAAMTMGVASLSACGGGDTSGGDTQSISLKIATTGNDKHQSTIAAQAFADKIAELSNGTITATVYPNSSLGSEREAAEGVKLGSLEMTVVTTDGTLPSWVPATQVLSIPYLFETKEEAYYVLDHFLQDELAPQFEAQGIKHLAFCELGFRHFTTNKREIQSAADLAGQSIRVQEATIWFALADSLGFIATPIPFNELYTALQQSTVDGQENPITSIATSAFDEVQRYMCLDGHTYGAESIIMNLELYNSLTEEQQGWVDEASIYARDHQREVVSSMEKEYLQQIKDSGVIVCETPDIQSFKDATADMYKQPDVAALVDPSLTEAVMAKVDEFKTKS